MNWKEAATFSSINSDEYKRSRYIFFNKLRWIERRSAWCGEASVSVVVLKSCLYNGPWSLHYAVVASLDATAPVYLMTRLRWSRHTHKNLPRCYLNSIYETRFFLPKTHSIHSISFCWFDRNNLKLVCFFIYINLFSIILLYYFLGCILKVCFSATSI